MIHCRKRCGYKSILTLVFDAVIVPEASLFVVELYTVDRDECQIIVKYYDRIIAGDFNDAFGIGNGDTIG